jgi:hypothetical protein
MTRLRGTTDECFAHLAQNIRVKGKAIIAEFIGVGQPTVNRWCRHGSVGHGESLVRVRCMLELLDYEVTDLMKLDAPVRELTRHLAYQLATFDDIVDIMAFDSLIPRNSTMGALTRDRPLSPARLERVRKYVKEYADVLELAHTERKEFLLLGLRLPESHQQAEEPLGVALKKSLPKANGGLTKPKTGEKSEHSLREAIICATAQQILALLPLVDSVLSDDFSAADRMRLRELAGGKGVFDLSNRLNRLCGEKARANIPQQAMSRS